MSGSTVCTALFKYCLSVLSVFSLSFFSACLFSECVLWCICLCVYCHVCMVGQVCVSGSFIAVGVSFVCV